MKTEYYLVSMPPDMPHEIRGELDAWYVVSEPIVWCRNCKWCMAYSEVTYCEFFAHRTPNTKPDGFCAWGEPKEVDG